MAGRRVEEGGTERKGGKVEGEGKVLAVRAHLETGEGKKTRRGKTKWA